jgi:hypothetical protein
VCFKSGDALADSGGAHALGAGCRRYAAVFYHAYIRIDQTQNIHQMLSAQFVEFT